MSIYWISHKKEEERGREGRGEERKVNNDRRMKRRRLLYIRMYINSPRIREVVRELMAIEENLFHFFSSFFNSVNTFSENGTDCK